MSDYDQWRDSHNLSRGSVDSGSGAGLFWILVVIAVVGLLILIGSFGGGSSSVVHPGGAGAEPVVVPTEGENSATGAEATGTVIE